MNAYDEGYSDYIQGRDREENPYSSNVTMFGEWLNGWEAAQSDDASCEDEAMERDSEAYMELQLLGE
jgi:ribosome modulation factor